MRATASFATTTGDQLGTGASPLDPLLGNLADNGGPTLTHALLNGSPAVDAGSPATPGSGGGACEITDQRGTTRPKGSQCDIGAFEALQADLQVSKSATPATVPAGATITYTVTVTNNGPDDAKGVFATDYLPSGVTFSSSSVGCTVVDSFTLGCPAGTSLASGASSTNTILVTVDAGATGPLVNTFAVVGGEVDPDLSNNASTATTTGQAPPPVPGLSAFGLVIFAVAAAGAAYIALRRRARALE